MKSTQNRIYEAAMRIFAERGTAQLTVSELSDAAGVARGTIYNNLSAPDDLFEEIATRLAAEMDTRITLSNAGIEDPAERVANGLRYFVRRAHEEPVWARFIVRFAFNHHLLQGAFSGPAAADLLQGIESGRFKVAPQMLDTVTSLLVGGALSAMMLVLDGRKTWRDGGSEVAELILRALGISPREARRIVRSELPELPPPAPSRA